MNIMNVLATKNNLSYCRKNLTIEKSETNKSFYLKIFIIK